jgi:hydroxyquinol 1,2-dioxygenase
MRHIDEDSITQAVIARHAAAGDARLRELMTSLVQHLHAFAREVRLSEHEWAEGLRFLADCGRLRSEQRDELGLLSDTLGVSTLIAAMNQRNPRGATETARFGQRHVGAAVDTGTGAPCFVRGRVRALDGTPIAGAQVQVWSCAAQPMPGVAASGADGGFAVACAAAGSPALPQDGPVGRMLRALGRHAWRPAHLHVAIEASGYEDLSTQLFRADDPYLDSDAVFGVRSSLIADWVRHGPGPTPDGHDSAVPFDTVDFTFVLIAAKGDKP